MPGRAKQVANDVLALFAQWWYVIGYITIVISVGTTMRPTILQVPHNPPHLLSMCFFVYAVGGGIAVIVLSHVFHLFSCRLSNLLARLRPSPAQCHVGESEAERKRKAFASQRAKGTDARVPTTVHHHVLRAGAYYVRLEMSILATVALALLITEAPFAKEWWRSVLIGTYIAVQAYSLLEGLPITHNSILGKLGTAHLIAVDAWLWLAGMEDEREHFSDIDSKFQAALNSTELQASLNGSELVEMRLFDAWVSLGMACKVDFCGTATALLMTIMLATVGPVAMGMSQESKISAGQRREPRQVSYTMGMKCHGASIGGDQMVIAMMISFVFLYFFGSLQTVVHATTTTNLVPDGFKQVIFAAHALALFFRFHSSVLCIETYKHLYNGEPDDPSGSEEVDA